MSLPFQYRDRALLTPNEICAIFGRSRGWLDNLRRAGHLTPVKIGRRCTSYRRDDVERLLENGISE